MTVQEMITQMGERIFDQSFQDYLSATCQTLPGMDFLTEEDSYKVTMDRLTGTIPLNLGAIDKVRLRRISAETDLAVDPISFAIWEKDALR